MHQPTTKPVLQLGNETALNYLPTFYPNHNLHNLLSKVMSLENWVLLQLLEDMTLDRRLRRLRL